MVLRIQLYDRNAIGEDAQPLAAILNVGSGLSSFL